ncbi:MAG: DMT family transporter, partial [Thermomicrobiales bacterium]|nr:DMT family transporter [Thermomicrobiales bacterium]
MKSTRSEFDLADVAMSAVVVIWATNNVFTKAVLPEIAPLAFIWARFAIVTPSLFAWLIARRRLELPRRADWPLFLVSGACGFGFYNVLFILGIDRTSAFAAALLLSLNPTITMLFASLLRIERGPPAQWLGAALATGGVALFVGESLRSDSPGAMAGNLMLVLGSVCFAVYSLSARSLVVTYGVQSTTAWSLLVGIAMLTPLAAQSVAAENWLTLSAAVWAALLYAALISLLLSYIIWAWAIARRGVTRSAAYLFLLPVVTGIFSAWLIGERFGPLQIAGAALVLG